METTPEIRPMGIGELLDRGFRIWRKHLATMFALALLPNALGYALNKILHAAFLPAPTLRPGDKHAIILFLLAIPVVLLAIIAHSWSTPALAHAAREGYLGRSAGFGDAARAGGRDYFRFLVTTFVLAILMAAGFLFCVAPGLYVLFTSLLVTPVVCFEGLGGFAAYRRSREVLGRTLGKPWWHIDRPLNKAGAVLLIVWMIQFVVSSMASIPTAVVMMVWILARKGAPHEIPQWVLVPAESVQIVVQSLVIPMQVIATVLLYMDQLHRTEGTDLLARLEAAPEA